MEESKKMENMNKDNKDNKNYALSLNDIIVLKNLVGISARRGAFSVEEFKEIGEIYEKVDGFCKQQTVLLEKGNVENEQNNVNEEATKI